MNNKKRIGWKVCGLREPGNILQVAATTPDWLGFIFYPKSPRYVGDDFQMPTLPVSPLKVGVFVNDSYERITAHVARHHLQGIQLHGDETAEDCARLQAPGRLLIKAVGVADSEDLTSLERFRSVVDLFLFDTKTSKRGGSGQTFNWDILKDYRLNIPFLLSGGLTIHNLEEALAMEHPYMTGVDLNSGLEVSPGYKDIEKVKRVSEIVTKHQQA